MTNFKNNKLYLEEIKKFIDQNYKPTVKSLYLELTKRCPFKCVHCFNQGLPVNKEMSYVDICSVLDQVADLGAYEVSITGGEPLLRPDLFNIIKYAKKKGFIIGLLTNAALITEDIAKKLADLYCHVNVSIYGMSNKTYKLITGVEAFTKVRRAVELMNREKIPFGVKMMLFKDNFSDAAKFIKWKKSLKMATSLISWYCNPAFRKDKMFAPFRYMLNKSQIEGLAKIYHHGVLPDPSKVHVQDDSPLCVCKVYSVPICVNAYGEVSPCQSLQTSTTFRDKPIKEIFLNDPWFVGCRKWTIKDAPHCRNCSVVGYCVPCVADFFLYTRKFGVLKPTKEMCRNSKWWFMDEIAKKMTKHKVPISSLSKSDKCG